MASAETLPGGEGVGTCRCVRWLFVFTALAVTGTAAANVAAAPQREAAKVETKAPVVPATLAHPTSYDVRVRVEPDGTATAEHALSIRVTSGFLRYLDLKATDKTAIAAGPATVTSDDGKSMIASLAVREDGGLRVEPVDDKGLKRGNYTFRFAVRTDLTKSSALRRDGVLYRITWASPPLGDGVDGMRVVFDLPAAATEPRAAGAGDGTAGEEGLLATLRRGPARDELEIVRPRVARGEAVLWEARVDPRALPAVRSPSFTSKPAPSAPAPEPDRHPVLLAAAVAIVVGLLVYAKGRGARAWSSPLVSIPLWLRAVLVGSGAAGASALAAEGEVGLAGGLAALSCLLVIARREPVTVHAARGPADWLVLRPEEAFPRGGASWFHLTSWRGRAALMAALGAAVASVHGAGALEPRAPAALVVIVAVLTALWCGDGAAPSVVASRLLARAHRRLARLRSVKAVPYARVPKGGANLEEVRVRVMPRHPMPGLLAVELGAAGDELGVLVRVRDESPAARKLAACAKLAAPGRLRTKTAESQARAVPGRTETERVLSLAPLSPTVAAACRLVREVSDVLLERREGPPADYCGPERRGAPAEARA